MTEETIQIRCSFKQVQPPPPPKGGGGGVILFQQTNRTYGHDRLSTPYGIPSPIALNDYWCTTKKNHLKLSKFVSNSYGQQRYLKKGANHMDETVMNYNACATIII